MARRIVQLKDGSFAYRAIYSVGGRRYEEVVGYLDADASNRRQRDLDNEVTAFLVKTRKDIKAGHWLPPKERKQKEEEQQRGPRRHHFKEVVQMFLETYTSKNGRIEHYERAAIHWRAFFRDCFIDEINRAEVERFRNARKRKASDETVRKDLQSLSTLFDWAEDNHYMEDNPTRRVPRPPKTKPNPNPLTRQDEVHLLRACPRWLRPLVRWGLATGWDRAEIIGLTWTNIDRDAGAIWKPRDKTRCDRETPIEGQVERLVKELGAHRRLGEDRAFLDDQGRPVTVAAVKSAMRRAWPGSGLKAAGKTRPWKTLRLTFATRLHGARVPVGTIASLMGLTIEHTLAYYIRPFDDERREAMRSIDRHHRSQRVDEKVDGGRTG